MQAILHVYKQHKLHSGKVVYQHAELDGKVFETSEAAHAAALERGYCKLFFNRPNQFITLRLAPATRRFLSGKSKEEICLFLLRISQGDSYVAQIIGRESSATFQRWMFYIQNPNFEAAKYTKSV